MLDMVDDQRFGMRISRKLLEQLDAWRRTLPVVPPRSAAIKQILAAFLEAEMAKAAKRKGRK